MLKGVRTGARQLVVQTMSENVSVTENVYQFLRQYIGEHGFAPSFREIGEACDMSIPTVTLCLAWLESRRRIRRSAGTARSIVLLDTDHGTE